MVAVPVASVLFGIIHFDWVQGSFAVFLGLWLGEITDRTGSVWPAVVGHAVNNAGATVMGALMGTDASSVTSSPGWELAVSVPLFLLCLLYLLRRPVVPVGPVSPAPPMPSVDPTLPAAPLV
jgi:membrane protease YdiL (CAAX protease family)